MSSMYQVPSSASSTPMPATIRGLRRRPLFWVSLWVMYALAALAYLGYQDAVSGLICGVA